jgi:hypothetical protein
MRADVIYHALQDCWNEALSTGARVLAVTVPECAARSPNLDMNRDTLNLHISEHESEQLWVYHKSESLGRCANLVQPGR